MLFKLSVHISNCLELAAAAEQRAKETTDPAIRSDNEKLAQSWRHLACSYQFVESLDRFLSDRKSNKADAVPADLPLITEEQAAPPESRPIIRRPRVKHATSFKDRLLKAAREAREQAAGLRSGAEYDRLLLKAQQCETAAKVDRWVSSPGSKPPDKLDHLIKTPRR